jgi:protein-L-isoaspartate(D-aspartate) O-methyltransferase
MAKEELINRLISSGVLKTPRLISAFKKIDRADFVRENLQSEAYEDFPLPIGESQTISQPTTVAFMLEQLDPAAGEKILDVGSGSGWTTALLASCVGIEALKSKIKSQKLKEKGRVIGVEIIPELVEFGQNNLQKYPALPAEIHRAGAELGWPSEAPYDKILVSAAADKVPKELIKQLKVGSLLVIPIGNSVFKIEKLGKNKTKEEEFPGFVFVPLKMKNSEL